MQNVKKEKNQTHLRVYHHTLPLLSHLSTSKLLFCRDLSIYFSPLSDLLLLISSPFGQQMAVALHFLSFLSFPLFLRAGAKMYVSFTPFLPFSLIHLSLYHFESVFKIFFLSLRPTRSPSFSGHFFLLLHKKTSSVHLCVSLFVFTCFSHFVSVLELIQVGSETPSSRSTSPLLCSLVFSLPISSPPHLDLSVFDILL